MNLIFIPAGTSFVDAEGLLPAINGSHFEYSSHDAWRSCPDDAQDYAQAAGEIVVERLARRSTEPPDRLTAEIASLRAIFANDESLSKGNTRGVFLASDSIAGRYGAAWARQAAALIWEEIDWKPDVDPENFPTVGGLTGEEAGRFETEGLPNLADAVLEHVTDAIPQSGDQIVFNITGGFKGAIPWLYLIALATKASVRYLFEHSAEPISIPLLQIDFSRVTNCPQSLDMFFERLRKLNKVVQGPISYP